MNIKDIKIAYFIGIGGIGMSAIARYFKSLGIAVHGYDRSQNDFTSQLISEGFNIRFYEDIQHIPKEIISSPKESIVIYTPAIPADHKEIVYLKEKKIKLYKRSETFTKKYENQNYVNQKNKNNMGQVSKIGLNQNR